MPRIVSTDEIEARFEEDLERLEQGLRTLKAAYNRYFVGSADRPPTELQSSLAALIRRQTDAGPTTGLRTSDKFRFNSIVSNFHVLTEMWNRNVRCIEEGRPTSLGGRSPRPEGHSPDRSAEREIFRTQISASDPNPQDTKWRSLYSSYLQAVRDTGREASSLSYQKFYDRLRDRLRQFEERTGQPDLTCRVVVVDNRPILKLGSGS